MINWYHIARLKFPLVVLMALLFCSVLNAEDSELQQQINLLDNKYQKLIGEFYQTTSAKSESIKNVENLLSRVISTSESQHPIPAIQLLVANLDTLIVSPDHPAIIKLTEFLLEQNEWQLANRILKQVEASGDDTNIAYLKYNFAKFYARLNQWQKVNYLVTDTFSELNSDDLDYAHLLQGSAQQHLKQHRLSIESYVKIPNSSKFYIHAQLNTAIANIRQGWITDARLIVKNLIPVSAAGSDTELTNRIYLVLGYALLHKEYYRDARDTFRKVSLNSQYTNKALLGIALTAISQSDYIGGLNALDNLKRQKNRDLSTDEAYILIPYVYERLNQPNIIADSFTDSIDHYQKRLLELSDIKHSKLKFENIRLEKASGDIYLHKLRFPFSQHYPVYLLSNRNNLHYLVSTNAAPHLTNKIKRLLQEYDETLSEVIIEIIERRKKIYTSYLNQSRYGLARHYDDQQQGAQ